jgi:replicative DNA helicase
MTEVKMPYSLRSEQSVIGMLLTDNSGFDDVKRILSANDFYSVPHKIVYIAITQLLIEQVTVDMAALVDFLKNNGVLEKAGGRQYISMLAKNEYCIASIAAYARVIKEKSVLREIVQVANNMIASATVESGADSTAIVAVALKGISAITKGCR